MEGELGRLYDGWRHRLTRALAHLEADIDFPDEDLPEGVAVMVRPELETLAGEIAAHLDDNRRGERLRDGIHIAILGAPNAGKSSLLNVLARREAAIVSERAGTTRDVVEVHLDLGGFPVVLADTAGLREAADEIESEGIRRALDRAANADLKLAVFDATALPELDAQTMAVVDDQTLVVVNKVDRASGAMVQEIGGQPAMRVSARTGEGLAGFAPDLDGCRADPVRSAGRSGTDPRPSSRRIGRVCRVASAGHDRRLAGACRRGCQACQPRLGPDYRPRRCRRSA